MKPFVFFKNESYGKEIPIEIIQIHPSVKSIIKSKKLANIEHTMKNDGQMYPVCGNLIDGVFYITDGVARYEVAKSLGWKTLKCLDINISEDDIIKNRMISNQKAQMSYTEMANSAEHLLGIIGKSQGKKRESLGFNDFDNDENYGTVGMDRYQAVIHLLNLPIGSSSLRKLMAVKWFEEENPDKKLGLMKGLDDGDFKLDKAYRLLQDRIKKQKNFDNRKLSAKEGRNNLVEYKLFNKSSLVMDEIEDNSIALFIDSHPYMDQREYRNQGDNPHGQEKTKQEYVSNFIMFCEEKKRKLKPGGYLVTILGESYSKGLSRNIISRVVVGLEDNGWEPIDLNVWVKTNQKDTPHPFRNRNTWEGVIVVRKPGGEPYFEEQIKGELDEIDFELGKTSLGDRYVKPKTSDATCITNVFTTSVFNNNELKAIDKDFKHDAPCPTSIYASMIKSYSKPNDWIVDGFVGSGTVSIGLTLGRNVIGYDVDPKSIEFCEKRFEKCLEERESFKEVSLMAA